MFVMTTQDLFCASRHVDDESKQQEETVLSTDPRITLSTTTSTGEAGVDLLDPPNQATNYSYASSCTSKTLPMGVSSPIDEAPLFLPPCEAERLQRLLEHSSSWMGYTNLPHSPTVTDRPDSGTLVSHILTSPRERAFSGRQSAEAAEKKLIAQFTQRFDKVEL